MKLLRRFAVVVTIGLAATTFGAQAASANQPIQGRIEVVNSNFQNAGLHVYVNPGPKQKFFAIDHHGYVPVNEVEGTRVEFWVAGKKPGKKLRTLTWQGGNFQMLCDSVACARVQP